MRWGPYSTCKEDDDIRPRRDRGRGSRDQKLRAAFGALEQGSPDAVRVKRLAETIGVNKKGFYCRFKGRA